MRHMHGRQFSTEKSLESVYMKSIRLPDMSEKNCLVWQIL